MTINFKKTMKSIGIVGIAGLLWWLITSINGFENTLNRHGDKIAQHTKDIDKLQDKVDARC